MLETPPYRYILLQGLGAFHMYWHAVLSPPLDRDELSATTAGVGDPSLAIAIRTASFRCRSLPGENISCSHAVLQTRSWVVGPSIRIRLRMRFIVARNCFAIRVMPNLPQLLPILQSNSPPFLRHHGCRCHIDTDSPRRFPWACQEGPNTRPRPAASSRPRSFSRGMECVAAVSPGR